MEEQVVQKKKSNVGLIIAFIIILLIAVAGSSFGGYLFGKNDADKAIKEKTECEEKLVATKTNKETTNATRVCEGKYTGDGAVIIDTVTNKTTNGKITIELTKEGTFVLSRELNGEKINGDKGKYVIVDGDVLLLKTSPHTGSSDTDFTPKTSEFLKIKEDCSTISNGYGSYFFDPNFTLTKQN